jgi:putative MATE family efflux protein
MGKRTVDHNVKSKSMHETPTAGVKTLLGDPKKAIIKLAVPMIIAMVATTIYNVVDAFWVSGLGSDALSAIGFFFPFFFMAISVAVGLGIGGGASISRSIGAKNKADADSAAVHTLVIMLILSVAFTFPFIIFAEPIFLAIGAGELTGITVEYGRIMFAGTILIFFSQVANAILRAEGDANRAMYALTLGAVLNIILDPIFIYTLNFGIAGAAWASVISFAITSVILLYWLFFKKDTYTSYAFRGFQWDKRIVKDIFSVGLPGMVMQLSMAFTMLITNVILVGVGGSDGVAVYSTGWRVVTVGILPLIGIATAVISVTGAAFGAKNYEKLKTAYNYSVKIGLGIGIFTAVLTFVFAPAIASVFTMSEKAAHIFDDLVLFFMISCIFYPAVPAGMFSSSMFQGVGKGNNALIVTLWRTIILTPPLALLFAYNFGMGLAGVWWGIVVGNLIGATTAYIWAQWYINCLQKAKKDEEPEKLCAISIRGVEDTGEN